MQVLSLRQLEVSQPSPGECMPKRRARTHEVSDPSVTLPGDGGRTQARTGPAVVLLHLSTAVKLGVTAWTL